MRIKCLLCVLACCVFAVGCNGAKVDELTKQIEDLRQQNEQLQAELQTAQQALEEAKAARDDLQQQAAQAAEIRRGYEQAREKFQEQLAGLGAALGAGAGNPLPPFEELKNSDWIGKLMPGAAADLGNLKDLKAIEGELLKELFGGQQEVPQE